MKDLNIPNSYPICEHKDCSVASTCLHHLVLMYMMQTENILQLINPKKCSKDVNCDFYRNNTPIIYARGFTNFQKHMYPEQYKSFMAKCMEHWSRNPYFERRRGDIPLSPIDQEFLFKTLKEVGVTEEMRFDNYEEDINWYD